MEIFIGFAYFIIGLCFGSFNNVLIYRLPNGISVFKKARSFCPKCHATLKWYHNIPLFSYIFLKGRCHFCKEKISITYPLVELSSALLALSAYLVFGFSFRSVIIALLLVFGVAIFMIDLKNYIIPICLNVVYAILGLCIVGNDLYDVITMNKMGEYNVFYDKITIFFSLLIGLSLLYLLTVLIFKREAVGLGDIILISAMSLTLGSLNTLYMILFASITCSIIALTLISLKKMRRQDPMPFGPFLISGFYFAVLFGDMITNSISQIF